MGGSNSQGFCQTDYMKTLITTAHVELQFPTVRLYLHELLANGKSTSSQAIAKAAVEFGLIDSKTAEQLRTEEQSKSCQCMAVAKKVLEHYFAQRNGIAGSLLTSAHVVFASLNSAVCTYLKSQHSSNNSSPSGKDHNCARFTPVLFDLLLQELRRYP